MTVCRPSVLGSKEPSKRLRTRCCHPKNDTKGLVHILTLTHTHTAAANSCITNTIWPSEASSFHHIHISFPAVDLKAHPQRISSCHTVTRASLHQYLRKNIDVYQHSQTHLSHVCLPVRLISLLLLSRQCFEIDSVLSFRCNGWSSETLNLAGWLTREVFFCCCCWDITIKWLQCPTFLTHTFFSN